MSSSDWQPTASIEAVRLRAKLYGAIREFFTQRDVLEVTTPLLSAAATTDPHIASLSVDSGRLFLQTSPEFAMKRLLAAGSGSIYQITKAFRGGEAGRRHRPEFTMLEWYRPELSYDQLMDEVADLVALMLGHAEVEKTSYRDLFLHHLGIDPHSVQLSELLALARTHADYRGAGDDRDALLDLLISHVIEPELGRNGPTFVYDYPASQCALAKVTVDRHGNKVAQRFELYLKGIELANGYQELTDWREQERRFVADNEKRKRAGLPVLPMDEQLVAALRHGMPECSGVALGVDRLLMLMLGTDDIKDVI